MKVLLLAHPITIDRAIEDNYGIFPPLGLAYIAALLERSGHKVEILDCLAEGFYIRKAHENNIRIGLSDEDILSRVQAFMPDVVGISNNFTSYYKDAVELAMIIKARFPDILLVAGGAHMTMEYQDSIKLPFIDIVVRGEGEYIITDILDCISHNKPFDNIKGLVWKKKDGNVIVNETREAISNIDDLLWPSYHLLNMKLYLSQKSFNFEYSKNYPIGHMITSRGCMYNCIFCSTSKHFKKFRARSIENVLDEMEFLIKKYGIREIHFHDDSFLCDSGRIYTLCNGILERKMKISWQASQGTTVWNITPELLSLMQKSGMYRIGLPIESGSEKILKFIRKPINLERALAVIDECNRLGIYTHGNFIIGFPYETKEDIDNTASFIYKCNLDFVKLLICQPLAGSDLYNVYLKEGLLKESLQSASTYENTKYDTATFTASELNRIRDEIMKKFFTIKIKNILSIKGFNKFVLPKLNSFDKLKYFLRLAFISLKRFILRKPVLGV